MPRFSPPRPAGLRGRFVAVIALLAGIGFFGGIAAPALAQGAAPPTTPTAIEVLISALRAHRGATPGRAPASLVFQGTVVVRSDKGDVNTFNLDEWYECVNGVDTIATRLIPAGGGPTSTGGFDGKRYYLMVSGKRKVIDFDSNYKKDVDRIKDDLARTRFIIDTFFAGALLEKPKELQYVRRSTRGKMASHVVDRVRDGKIVTRYYVNAKKGEKPYFTGIEFPKTTNAPKQNFCFSVNEKYIKRFGGVALPQDMKVFHDDGAKPVAEIWITKLAIDQKQKPKWLPRK